MSKIWNALDDALSWDTPGTSNSEVDQDQGHDSNYGIIVSSTSSSAVSSAQRLIVSSMGSSSSAASTEAKSSTPAQVVEWLFALSCQFVAQVAPPGTEDSLPLVHFVGVLGIHSYNLVYRSAFAFTPSVAGLLWVCRLLMLEYALPLRHYDHINWPSQGSYDDQLVQLQYVQRKFLCCGSFHPAAYLFEVLVTGQRIAYKEGRRTNISWSKDKEVLVLYNERVTMSAFWQMVWSSVQKCSNLLTEAMFGWAPPAIDLLALHDDLTENRPGWSFLKEPGNHLEHSFQHLQRQAFTAEHLMVGGKWSLQRCQKYFSQVEDLKKHLLNCIHFTGGLPGRATEVTIVKWCNTRKTMRNVFFYHRRAIIIFEYLKTRATTNHSFYVVRVLPLVVTQMLFQYLTWIRPFCDALTHQLQLGQTTLQNHYLFTSGDQLYTSQTLSKTISQLSRNAKAGLLTVATYRQAAISIAKTHIPSIPASFNLNHPINENDTYLCIARQTGHSIQTLRSDYGRDRAYPCQLQPELMSQYERTSKDWHQWLRLEKLDRELQDITKSRKVKTEVEMKRKRAVSDSQPIETIVAKQPCVHKGQATDSEQVLVPRHVLDALLVVAEYFKGANVQTEA
ncbi:hypothetical protein V502_01471 [Pseudogymnoascus sp. VKM F-4520 (FW-2644)]|nr:hypothetical protein V502_01471 [Pseudogymnoascus sp. VKM F-4520 (FW-2644)]